MRKLLTLLVLALYVSPVVSQSIEKDLAPFHKILIGPGINVELIKSDREHVRLVSDSKKIDDLVVDVVDGELKIFFSHTKFDLNDDEPYINSKISLSGTPYEGVEVYAKLFYSRLDGIDFRGEGKLFAKENISSPLFDLKIYGDCEVKLAGIEAQKINAAFYGENDIDILRGYVGYFKIKSFGENELRANGLKAEDIKLTSMGEGDFEVHAENIFKVKIIGEGDVRYSGNPEVKEFNLGEARIHKIDYQ